MDFTQVEGSPSKRLGGFVFVVALHVIVAYVVVSGLGKKLVDVVKEPLETKIIEEVKPPPPPKVEPPPPPPKPTAPPPPFIPPPEVVVQTPTTPTPIATISNQQPAHQDFVKTAPAPDAPIAPPRPAAPPVPAFSDLNSCKPTYPRASQLAEETGTVKVRLTVGANGQLVNAAIVKSSGFKGLDRATLSAFSACKFRAAVVDGKPVEASFDAEYVWKLDD